MAMKGYYQKVGSAKKTFPKPVPTEQYEHPIGPERPTSVQRFTSDHPIVGKVTGAVKAGGAWVAERGREIQREGTGIPAPRRTPMQSLPADPYGMSRSGNPFGGSSFPYSNHPFSGQPGPIYNDRQPPRKPATTTRTIYHENGDVEVIRSGGKSRKPRRQRQGNGGGGITDPFHIPKSMRHLF